MAFQYGYSMLSELKDALHKRVQAEEQFNYYKRVYDVLIAELVEEFRVSEDTVCAALFLSRFVMSDVEGEQQRTSDDARTKIIIKNVIEARQHMKLELKALVQLYQLTSEVALKIEKEMVKQVRMRVRMSVVLTNLADIYVKPLIKIYQELSPGTDLRWVMAEIEAALQKKPAKQYFEEFSRFPTTRLSPENFFDASKVILERYIHFYYSRKQYTEEQEQLGDIGKKKFVFGISGYYSEKDNRLLFKPQMTDVKYGETSDDFIPLFTELMSSNHPLFLKDNPFSLRYCRYRVKIEGETARYFFVLNHYEPDFDVGVWSTMLISSEDVNMSSYIKYMKERCKTDIKGIMERKITEFLDQYQSVDSKQLIEIEDINFWDETTIWNLQEEADFLTTIDEYREKEFTPIGAIEQELATNIVDFLIESGTDDFSQELLKFINPLIDHFITVGQVLLRFIYIGLMNLPDTDTKVLREKGVEITPVEVMYEKKSDDTTENILFEFSFDERRTLGLINYDHDSFKVKGVRESDERHMRSFRGQRIPLKRRLIERKLHQIITARRIKSLEVSLKTKIQESFTNMNLKSLSKKGIISVFSKVKNLDGETEDEISLIQDKISEEKAEEERQLHVLRIGYFEKIVTEIMINAFYTAFQITLLNRLSTQEFLPALNYTDRLGKLQRQLNQIKEQSSKELPLKILAIVINSIEEIKTREELSMSWIQERFEVAKNLVFKMSKEDIAILF